MGDGTIGSTAAELQGLAKESAGKAKDDVDLEVEGAAEQNRAGSEQRTTDPDDEAEADASAD